MSTYFETVKKVRLSLSLPHPSTPSLHGAASLTHAPQSYADVPTTEEGVDTSAFLEATDGLVKLFDLLGSSAFAIVQNDMRGNVKVSLARLARER